MKKIIALFLVLALVLGLSVSAMADPVTITYAHFSGAGAQEETLKKITTLTLNHLPEDLSLLEQYFPNLQKIRLPESEAKNALSTLNGAYAVVVLPKGVDLP